VKQHRFKLMQIKTVIYASGIFKKLLYTKNFLKQIIMEYKQKIKLFSEIFILFHQNPILIQYKLLY